MENTQTEYLAFFKNWLYKQFSRDEDIVHNVLTMQKVKNYVDSDEEAEYWSNRDCWTMYDIVRTINF